MKLTDESKENLTSSQNEINLAIDYIYQLENSDLLIGITDIETNTYFSQQVFTSTRNKLKRKLSEPIIWELAEHEYKPRNDTDLDFSFIAEYDFHEKEQETSVLTQSLNQTEENKEIDKENEKPKRGPRSKRTNKRAQTTPLTEAEQTKKNYNLRVRCKDQANSMTEMIRNESFPNIDSNKKRKRTTKKNQ